MSTLYRLYRPQKFADVTGQEHIIQTITNEICAAKTAHAYLFSGPRGTGKTTLARLLAKAVNCQNRKDGESEPCNECPSCAEISASRNIDVMEIDAASHTGVENVRENIIDSAQFQPTKSKYKIFIIDEVHMLSTPAFNALLKTLEEPPAHVIFVLATTELQKLPATIVSRCQRFTFKKIGFDQMMSKLLKICKDQDVKVDKKVLERVINKSDGCMRDAESLLGQILTLNQKNIGPEDAEMILPTSNARQILNFVDAILNRDVKSAVALINELVSDGVNLEQFAYDALEILRLLMILQYDPTKEILDYSDEDAKLIKKMTKQAPAEQIIKLTDALMARRAQIKSAPIPQLPLELFAVEFSNCHSGLDTESIAANCHSEAPLSGDGESLSPSITQKIKTTLDEIKNKWHDITAGLTEQNHSLGFILKMGEPARMEGNELYLRVPFSLHKEKIEEQKTKKLIEGAMTDAFGEKICLICEVTQAQNDDGEITQLASEFGGEVVSL
ncbi:DNA polymerase III subunit gamma/tau [Patescibacteria group bacterium]|nr:MAG: DNA polymerase III subunit gamma/tau [Patescibacteria group bacterium]